MVKFGPHSCPVSSLLRCPYVPAFDISSLRPSFPVSLVVFVFAPSSFTSQDDDDIHCDRQRAHSKGAPFRRTVQADRRDDVRFRGRPGLWLFPVLVQQEAATPGEILASSVTTRNTTYPGRADRTGFDVLNGRRMAGGRSIFTIQLVGWRRIGLWGDMEWMRRVAIAGNNRSKNIRLERVTFFRIPPVVAARNAVRT